MAFAQIHYDSGYSRRNGALDHYYRMVNFDDSQYKEMTYWVENSAQFMNWRVIFPPGYNKNDGKKYPMIVMLHGAGESGRSWTGRYDYPPADPRYDNNGVNILHGGDAHRVAVNRNPADPKAFPGIVIFPQVSDNGAWGNVWNGGQQGQTGQNAAKIIEYMISAYHADENRVYLHGLSNGAKGVWDFASKRPDLIAAALPMSGVGSDKAGMNSALVTTPMWVFQGGLDTNPAPGFTQSWINDLTARGGKPRYTLYPNLGHGTWYTAYGEPDFFSWILKQDKRNVFIFGDLPETCNGSPVKFGFSAGYLAYQWTRNGADIAGASTRFYTTTLPGIYTVKYKKRTNNQWDESFPVNLCVNQDVQPPSVPQNVAMSNITFTSATASWTASTDNVGVSGYKVYLDGNLVATTVTPTYTFTSLAMASNHTVQVKATDASSNMSALSPAVPFTTLDDTTAPTTPANLAVSLITSTTAHVTWSSSTDNVSVTGYQVYRDEVFVANTINTSYDFASLAEASTHQVKVRAFDGKTNYSAFTTAVGFSTTTDIEPPTVPTNLAISTITTTSASGAWSASTDNYGVAGYEVYLNDVLKGITVNPAYDFSGLSAGSLYHAKVRAYDSKGNKSAFGSTVDFNTPIEVQGENGLNYSYYSSAQPWPGLVLPNFSTLSPQKTGTINNFDLYAIREQNDKFAIVFEGYLQVDVPGNYTFFTRSDEGSRLYLEGNMVVDNDGIHAIQERSGNYSFAAPGLYPIKVEYYDQYGVQDLFVDYKPQGGSKTPIPDNKLFLSGGMAPAATFARMAAPTISVSPNPFTNELTVNVDGATTVSIYDFNGYVVKSVTTKPEDTYVIIDVSGLAVGTYIVAVGNERLRIIKQ